MLTARIMTERVLKKSIASTARISAIKAPNGGSPNPPAIAPAINPDAEKKKASCARMRVYGSICFMRIPSKEILRFWKTHEWEIIVACIVLAVALLSYGLGYLSAKDAARAPIIIETRTSE